MRTHTSATNRDRGFTLIELMVVAIIFAVLSAVSVPIYLRHRAKSDVESVRKDAEQAALALTARLTGSGTLPATLNADNPSLWGYKASSPNNRLIEYVAAEDRFRLCVLNVATNPDAWAVYTSASEKVNAGTGTEPTGACDGDPTSPALEAEPSRGPSTPIAAPTPTAIPTVTPPPAPPAPTGLTVTSVLGEDQARLTWNASDGAASYRVYVDGSATPTWSGTALNTVVPSLANGTRSFRVTAVQRLRESSLSSPASTIIDSNDTIANAHTIPFVSSASSYHSPDHSNATATVQSGETTPNARSLWWRFTPTTNQTYGFTAVAPGDGSAAPATPTVTVWRVPSGSTAIPSPTPAIVARGAYNPTGSQTASGQEPLVTVQVGYDYLVRVAASSASDTGKFRLRVSRSPSADNLATPYTITQPAVGANTTALNSMVYTGAEASEPGNNLSSIWFAMQKVRAGHIQIDATATTFTPVITVYATSATNPASLPAPLRTVTGTSLTLTDAEVALNANLRIRISASADGTRTGINVKVSTIQAQTCFTPRYISGPSGNEVEWDPFPNATSYRVNVWEGDYFVGGWYVYPGEALRAGPVAQYESLDVFAMTPSGTVGWGQCQ